MENPEYWIAWITRINRKIIINNDMYPYTCTVEPLINGHFGDKVFCPLQGGVCYVQRKYENYGKCSNSNTTLISRLSTQVFVTVTSGKQP